MGIQIVDQEYKLSATGQIATWRLFLGDMESGLQRCVGGINSYDKTKKFGVAAGANVYVCSNGMFTSEIVHMRKHTGNILDDMQEMIRRALSYVEVSFKNALETYEFYKDFKLEKSAVNEIIGQLVLEEQLIKNEQLSIIKYGINSDPNFSLKTDPSLWNLYNVVTEALKRTHPADFIQDHVALHQMFDKKVRDWGHNPRKWSLTKDGVMVADASIIQDPLPGDPNIQKVKEVYTVQETEMYTAPEQRVKIEQVEAEAEEF